nr:MAG TPA_asm: hypothetical protein [Caudoviricetes sp.]
MAVRDFCMKMAPPVLMQTTVSPGCHCDQGASAAVASLITSTRR